MGSAGEIPDETVDASDAPGGAKPSRELAAGSTLGKYRLERVLGVGGMGVVWAAHDPDLERAVALKVLKVENAAVELRSRLLREARAMARLKHPNVLTVYEVDSEADRDFIAMELVDGASLDGWIAARPTVGELWDAVVAAGRGLAAAHAGGLVHRDFKPHNVLRSRDGRVLVTDFGLARSRGDDEIAGPIAMEVTLPAVSGIEATLDAATPAGTKVRSVSSTSPTARSSLDAPLTQTGVMIGTPAYMAPEQFLGATPDPRTDQFAFCVTAWQLLAGERPFRGTTLDELKQAAEAGVGGVKAKLPGAVRTVLARGLSPDPTKRWPDMNALLAALEHARGAPGRRVRIAFAIVVVALCVGLGIKLFTRPAAQPVAESSACPLSAEDEMAKAWSPALNEQWARHFDNSPGFQIAAGELAAFAKRWIEDYRSACASPPSTKTFAKLGCLLGERDEVAGIVELVPTVPPSEISEIEMGGVLPRTQACDGDTPVPPPTLPEDPAQREKIKALRPKLIAMRFGPPKMMVGMAPALLREAETIGWDPVVAEAHQAYAIAAQRAGERWELARDHFKKANQLARRTHHYHLEADTWIGLLEGELDAATDPGSDQEFVELVAQARIAAKNGGDDPVYLARITRTEGVYAICHGRIDEAIAKLTQARDMELSARDIAVATRFSVELADTIIKRNRPGDLDLAWQVVLDAERIATATKLTRRKMQSLHVMAGFLAALRGDLATAHAWADRAGPAKPPEGAVAITGRVVDGDGKGVAGATVVAWQGRMVGDRERIYLGSLIEGADIVTAGGDGTFTVRAVRGQSAIIAEAGTKRSRPAVIGDGEVTLALEPTRAIAGTVATDDEVLTGIIAFARYDLAPKLAFEVMAPVDARTHAYQLGGIPGGEPTLRLDNALDPNRPLRKLVAGPARDGVTPRWPVGPTLDVVVHTTDHETMVWVFRGKRTAKTHSDLDKLVETTSESIVHPALVVGIGDQTLEGMKRYRRGDRHAVFLGNAPGEITVCVARLPPTSLTTCQTLVLEAGKVGMQDGRGVYPVVAVELTPP